jgi:hypothetical protein
LAIVVPTRSWREVSLRKAQHLKNSLNFVSTCLKVVDTRRKGQSGEQKQNTMQAQAGSATLLNHSVESRRAQCYTTQM